MAKYAGFQILGCLVCLLAMSEQRYTEQGDTDTFPSGRRYISQRTKELSAASNPQTGTKAGINSKSLEQPYIPIDRATKNRSPHVKPDKDLLEVKRLARKLSVKRKKHRHNQEERSRVISTEDKYSDVEKSKYHRKISQRTKKHGQIYQEEVDRPENRSTIQEEDRQATLAPTHPRHQQRSRQTKLEKYHQRSKFSNGAKKKQDEGPAGMEKLEIATSTTSSYLSTTHNQLSNDNSSTLSETEHIATKENVRKIHLEMIKEKILLALGLNAPPNVTKHLPMLPDGFLGDFALRDEPRNPPEENLHVKPSQAVIFSNQDPMLCPQEGAKCIGFKLDHLSGQEVVSAELWLYKQYDPLDHYNHTMVVYELESNKDKEPSIRKIVGAMHTGIKRGWIKFNILDTAAFWIDKPHRNQGIQILCKTCKHGKNRGTPVATSKAIRPVLVINFSKGHHRVPRSLLRTCQNKVMICCKERLVVDFKAIGWASWILYPKSFESNFCRGSCTNLMEMPHMLPRHTQLMMEMASQLDGDLAEELHACCSPTKLSGISMMYWINENELIKKDLEGMVVEDCACTV